MYLQCFLYSANVPCRICMYSLLPACYRSVKAIFLVTSGLIISCTKKKKSLERVGGETKDQACCQLIRLSRALIREVWRALAFGSSELTISAISGNVMLLEASSAHV